MSVATDSQMVWYEDGHSLFLELNRSEVVVTAVICPNSEGSSCRQNRQVGCIVNHFVMRFGLECNVGVCPASDQIPIAWGIAGDIHDVDLCQVWIVPVTDDVYSAWASTMRSS